MLEVVVELYVVVQICFPACGASPTATAHALPPQSRSGLWCSAGGVCLLVVWALWHLLFLCGHCKVVIGCSSCHVLFFPLLQLSRDSTSPVSDCSPLMAFGPPSGAGHA